LDWIISAIFWTITVVWLATPVIVLWPARKTKLLSRPGTIIGAALVVLGNGAAWYLATHYPTSTAVLVFFVAPAYILGAQLLLAGADLGIRAAARGWRRGRGRTVAE
jgi:hypothetical protein